MAKLSSYKELEAWKKARVLVREIYLLTSKFPKEEMYELESELYLSFDLNLMKQEELDKVLELPMDCRKLLSGFINYLEASTLK